MSTISASTTSTTAYKVTADTTGTLVLQTGATPTTAVTIDTSQNVGIGTSSPSTFGKFAVSGSVGVTSIDSAGVRLQFSRASTNYVEATNGSGSLSFGTGGADTNRMLIDSSGRVMIGSTNYAPTATPGLYFFPSATAPFTYQTLSGTTNSDTTNHIYSTTAANFRFYVGMAGTVYATSTTITGISDARLKENIRDLDDGLDVVLALRPRKFDWKEGKGQNIKNARGFIAQEFETVLPDMIEEWKDPAPEGEEPYKAVNANLIPTLVKAIQELKAELDAAKAEIATLKGAA